MNAYRLRLWAAALREQHRTKCRLLADAMLLGYSDRRIYWYGICTDPILTPAKGWIQTASWFKDYGGYTFEQIADMIDSLADDGGGE